MLLKGAVNSALKSSSNEYGRTCFHHGLLKEVFCLAAVLLVARCQLSTVEYNVLIESSIVIYVGFIF